MSTELALGPDQLDDASVVSIAAAWLARLQGLINERDTTLVEGLFAPHGSWRDLLALTWDIQSFIGVDPIADLVANSNTNSGTVELVLSEDHPPVLVEAGPAGRWIQLVFNFTTKFGAAQGFARLVPAGPAWTAWTVSTELVTLGEGGRETTTWSSTGNPEWTTSEVGRPNWEDRRDPSRPLPESPTVLIVGGGQSGLAIAARFEHLGVDYAVIEKSDHLGASWRNRHYNLITHTPSFTDHFPYLPFPKAWPISSGKDKIANWLEFYAGAMDLNVWTSTELVSGRFEEATGRWSVAVRDVSGEETTLSPQHIVLATGLLSVPFVPQLAGRETFAGEIMHSSQYRSGSAYRGKKVVVVGSGASGHDIAQDLHEQGVEDVTMVQRSATYVMSFQNGVQSSYGPFYDENSDIDLADLAFRSVPLPVAAGLSSASAPVVAEMDKELLAGLEKIGFALNHDGMLAVGLRTGGVSGYYINQGCSELLIERKIKLKRGSVTGFGEHTVEFADDSTLDADVVVLCTGYQNMREGARTLFGDDVADSCKEAWILDFDRGGEHSNLWSDSGHPNLWFMAGSLHYSRLYSQQLALRIKADHLGLTGR